MGKQLSILVIGAGASGLAAAISAARCGAAVTLLERMKKPGKKLLMTGNGRCNLTNLDPLLPARYDVGSSSASRCKETNPQLPKYCSGKTAFVSQIFEAFSVGDTLAFFEELGVAAFAEESGLIYPRSGQAQSVLSALLAELERLHVKQKYNVDIRSLSYSKKSGTWMAATDGWTYEADRVILCCGSKTAPLTGSDGSGYALASMAGHSITAVKPALTGLLCGIPAQKTLSALAQTGNNAADLFPDPGNTSAKALFSLASGARSKAKLSLFLKDQLLIREQGELQWTQYGVSGIAAFQLSRFAARAGLDEKKGEGIASPPLVLLIDLVPDREEPDICAALLRMKNHAGSAISQKKLLSAYVHERVAAFLDALYPAKDLTAERIPQIARILKALPLEVTGLKGFEQAQVCTGGVPLAEVSPLTLQSRIAPGLFFAGEILDVDGPCGGYNLQWAWSSGYVAGKASCSKTS